MIQTESSEQIHVHKTILKMRSKYFEAKLPQLLKNDDKYVSIFRITYYFYSIDQCRGFIYAFRNSLIIM